MSNVTRRRCTAPGCGKQASYGAPGGAPMACLRHSANSHVNVRRRAAPAAAQGTACAEAGAGGRGAGREVRTDELALNGDVAKMGIDDLRQCVPPAPAPAPAPARGPSPGHASAHPAPSAAYRSVVQLRARLAAAGLPLLRLDELARVETRAPPAVRRPRAWLARARRGGQRVREAEGRRGEVVRGDARGRLRGRRAEGARSWRGCSKWR
jgi:hypothetical protein